MINFRRNSFSAILFLTSFLLISCSSKIKDSSLNLNEPLEKTQASKKRVVALTSLTSDLVDRLSPESLVAIPGSRLLKSNEKFKDKIVVSQGRNPPNIEKIISLKPDLVLGAKGFHDKALFQINDLGIEVISTKIKDWNESVWRGVFFIFLVPVLSMFLGFWSPTSLLEGLVNKFF